MSQLTMDIGPIAAPKSDRKRAFGMEVAPRSDRERAFGIAVAYVAEGIRQGLTYEQARSLHQGHGGPGEAYREISQGRVAVRFGWHEHALVVTFPLERVWSAAERRASEEG